MFPGDTKQLIICLNKKKEEKKLELYNIAVGVEVHQHLHVPLPFHSAPYASVASKFQTRQTSVHQVWTKDHSELPRSETIERISIKANGATFFRGLV